MLPDWVNDYVGIPFVDGGRTREGCDCYGLVCLVFAEQFKVTLPRRDYWPLVSDVSYLDRSIEEVRTVFWRPVEGQAWPGCVAEFRVPGKDRTLFHCGLMVSPTHMLHVFRGCETVLEEVYGLVWTNRLMGIYRYAG